MSHSFRLAAPAAAVLAVLLTGCAAPTHTSVHADASYRTPPAWAPLPPPPPPAPVVSVYVEPPLVQPEPVFIDVAPPPMLVEVPPPQPYPGAVWTGGYWGWQGRWVWCVGRWSSPPRADYVWVQPYYEHRDGAVVFVSGYWAAHGVGFVPPPPGLHLSVQIAIGGGARPMGPMGVFVPPPPGSRAGLIVPAPVGTPPAVVVSAPPVTNVGMRIQHNNNTQINRTVVNNSVVNNNTTVNNVRNETTITNVTIVAPPNATANGKPFQGDVPAAAHLAAALPAVVHAPAPALQQQPQPQPQPQPMPHQQQAQAQQQQLQQQQQQQQQQREQAQQREQQREQQRAQDVQREREAAHAHDAAREREVERQHELATQAPRSAASTPPPRQAAPADDRREGDRAREHDKQHAKDREKQRELEKEKEKEKERER